MVLVVGWNAPDAWFKRSPAVSAGGLGGLNGLALVLCAMDDKKDRRFPTGWWALGQWEGGPYGRY